MKQGKDENKCFVLFYIQSFTPSSLPSHSYTSHPILSDIFRTLLQDHNTICIWIIPRLSFISWCINKLFLPTQVQSLFKFSLVSLVHFPYSDAVDKRMLSALSAAWPAMFLLCQILWLCPLYLSQTFSSFIERTGKGFQTLHVTSAITPFKYLIFFLRHLLWETF